MTKLTSDQASKRFDALIEHHLKYADAAAWLREQGDEINATSLNNWFLGLHYKRKLHVNQLVIRYAVAHMPAQARYELFRLAVEKMQMLRAMGTLHHRNAYQFVRLLVGPRLSERPVKMAIEDLGLHRAAATLAYHEIGEALDAKGYRWLRLLCSLDLYARAYPAVLMPTEENTSPSA